MADQYAELLQRLLQASPDVLIVVDEHGLITMTNPAVETMFGYTPEELWGKPVEVLLPDDVREAHVGHRVHFSEHPHARPMGQGLNLHGRRRDGNVFPVDVSLAPAQVEGKTRIGAFVRDATESRRGSDLLGFVNEISRRVLGGATTDDILGLTASRARRLLHADVAWVVVPDPSNPELVTVAAADGSGTGGLVGAVIAVEGSLASRAMATASTISVSDMSGEPAVLPEGRVLGLGPGLYLPMLAETGAVGTLVLARTTGEFNAREVAAGEVFAAAAAVVFALGQAREALEHARMTGEQERIARDLHDTVIQRLFALGMRLQAAERLADPVVAERIRTTVDSIDEVIREIRETIFDLNRPGQGDSSVRHQVRRLAAEAAEQLGFSPRVAFRGPVETAVSDELAPQVLSVLREALSNASRHARASSVDVVLIAADGSITLSVSDDGRGMADEPTAGHGLANMASRAKALGGDLKVAGRSPSGTLLQWRVPSRV